MPMSGEARSDQGVGGQDEGQVRGSEAEILAAIHELTRTIAVMADSTHRIAEAILMGLADQGPQDDEPQDDERQAVPRYLDGT